MRQTAMLRFLDLVRKELDAQDTRAELGGLDPDDERLLWARVAGGFRIVAVFAEPVRDRERDGKQAHLEHLVAGFSQTLTQASLPAPPSAPETAAKRLDEALEALRARTGAVGVVIVDGHSPVLWGASDPERHADDVNELVKIGDAIGALLALDVDLDAICALRGADAAQRLRELWGSRAAPGLGGGTASERDRALSLLASALDGPDETAVRHYLLTCLAVARTRHQVSSPTPTPNSRWVHHDVQFGYLVRGFANIYLLVLVFEGAFSELYVESAVVHTLPAIEQMLLALPPLDPDPGAKRGRVIPLHRR